MVDAGLSERRGPARLAITAAACLLLILCSIAFVDRPVALFVHAHLHGMSLFVDLTYIPEVLAPIAAVVVVWFGCGMALGRPWGPSGMVLLRCSISLFAAVGIKDRLKYAFGRTWPETWTHGNPSFIGDGTFGFFPFHGGEGWASFPSGHATATCAVLAVLWLHWPQFRWLYLVIGALVAIGLIGADFHWTSDVIAGGFLGSATGIVAARVGKGR